MDLKSVLADSHRGMEQVQTFMRLSVLATLRLRSATETDEPVVKVMEGISRNPLTGFHALVVLTSDSWEVEYDEGEAKFYCINSDAGLSATIDASTGEMT